MSILDFSDKKPFGKVQSVDTSVVIVRVDDAEQLSKLQVNNFVAIRSSKSGQILIGMVSKIMRKFSSEIDFDEDELREFLYNNRKVINVTAKISIQVNEKPCGTIFAGRTRR